MRSERSRSKGLRTAGTFLALVFVYLLMAIPFKVLVVIPGFTEIRPVLLLKPVYGIFFGIPGCLAFAVGNFIGDLIGDSLRWSSIAGFAANFAGPFVYWLYWSRFSRTAFSLRTGKDLLRQLAVTVVSAALESLLITPVVMLAYSDVDGMLFAATVFLNGTVFPLLLGIPLMILMQEEFGFRPAHAPTRR